MYYGTQSSTEIDFFLNLSEFHGNIPTEYEPIMNFGAVPAERLTRFVPGRFASMGCREPRSLKRNRITRHNS